MLYPGKEIDIFVERLVPTKLERKDPLFWKFRKVMSHLQVVKSFTYIYWHVIDVRLVADQFKASWRHSGKVCPSVKGVYKIIGSQTSLSKYDAYR